MMHRLSLRRLAVAILAILAIVVIALAVSNDRHRADDGAAQAALPYRVWLASVRNNDDGIAPILLPGRVDPFGVRIDPLTSSTGLSAAEAVGVHWTRTSLAWSVVQPTDAVPAEYHWETYDTAFRTAADHGVTAIATVGNNPSWAAPTSCGPLTPTMTIRMEEFLEAAARRYAGGPYNVRYWEFFNEPDLQPTPENPSFGEKIGGCWGAYPDAYAESLGAAYDAIKRGNPDAVVIFGGLAFDWFKDDGKTYPWGTCPGYYFIRSFLDDVLKAERASGRRIFDVMNFHYFKTYDGCWSDDLYGPGVIGKATVIRQRMARQGIYDRPLIVTEYGHYSSEGFGSTEETQARSVVQMTAEAMAADLRVMIWYTMFDDDSAFRWGLVAGNGRKRPAYTAYGITARMLAGVGYVGKVSGVAGVVGYRFQGRDGRCVDVIWSADGSSRQAVYRSSQIEVTQKLGAATAYSDGDPNQIAGQIAFTVTGDPVFVTQPACP